VDRGQPAAWNQHHRLGLISYERALDDRFNAYVTYGARLTGPLDLTRLNDAWHLVQARHPALLTRFDAERRWWHTEPTTPRDLTAVHSPPRPVSEVELTRRLQAPFDIVTGPLARMCAVVEGASSTLVGFSAEHLVADGWSTGVIARDLWRLYLDPSAQLPVSTNFQTIVGRQRSYLSSAVGARLLTHKTNELRDVGPLPRVELPGYHEAAHPEEVPAAHVGLALDERTFHRLRAKGSRFGLSVMSLALAALTAACHRFVDGPVGISMTLANRTDPETRHTVGWLSDDVVVLSRPHPERVSNAYLAAFATSLADALDASRIPSHALLNEMAPHLLGAPTYFPRVLFNPMPTTIKRCFPAPDLAGLTLTRISVPSSWVGADLQVRATDTRSLVLRIVYKPRCYDAASVRNLRDVMSELLLRWAAT
jgi:hypothetical protein